jgi:hypothetical protein
MWPSSCKFIQNLYSLFHHLKQNVSNHWWGRRSGQHMNKVYQNKSQLFYWLYNQDMHQTLAWNLNCYCITLKTLLFRYYFSTHSQHINKLYNKQVNGIRLYLTNTLSMNIALHSWISPLVSQKNLYLKRIALNKILSYYYSDSEKRPMLVEPKNDQIRHALY